MRLRSSLSSVALAATLLATSSLFSGAMAQKTDILSPLSQWAVTKVDDGGGDAGAYCALARRFKEDAILTIARNSGNETSIALDFQAPRLRPAQSMSVALDPGSGEIRNFTTQPVSNSAFVVRLGKDEPFFRALKNTGLLRIEADGQSFIFNLADIDAGQMKLNSCLVSLGGAAPAPAAAVPPDGKSADAGMGAASTGTGDELADMRKDIEHLRLENERLSGLVTKSSNLQTLNQPQAHDEIIASELSDRAKKLSEANDKLRVRVNESANAAPLANTRGISDLRQQNQKLQAQLNQIAYRVAGDDDGDVQPQQMSDRLASLRSENHTMRLNGDRQTGIAAGDEDPKAEIFSLRSENARMQKMLEQKSGSEVLADNLQSQVQTLQAQNDKLNSDLQRSENTTSTAPVAASAPNVTPVSSDLQKTIDLLKTQIAEKDKKLVDMAALTLEADNLRAKNKEMEQKLLANTGDKSGIDALNKKVQSLEQENLKLVSQISANSKGVADPGKIAALTKENEDLKKQIATLQDGAKQIDSMKVELASLRKENAELKAQPKDITQPVPVSAADSAELENLRKENAALKEKLAAQVKKSDGLEAQLKDVQAKAEADKEKTMHAMAQENEGLKQKLAKLQHETADNQAVEKASAPEKTAAAESAPKKSYAPVKVAAPEKTPTPMPDAKEVAAMPAPAPLKEEIAADLPATVDEDMSEAQKQEEMMRAASHAPAKMADAAAQNPSVPIEAHQSADPFAGMKTEDKSASKDAPKDSVQVAASVTSAPGSSTIAPDESINWNEPGSTPKPVEKSEIPAPPPVPTSAPAAPKTPEKMAAASTPKMPSPTSGAGYYQPAFSVPDALSGAKVASGGDIQLVDKVSGSERLAYQWKSGDVYGSSEQKPLADVSTFDAEVKEYLEKTHKRCGGDFAVAPDNSTDLGTARIDTYEIACVGKGVNTSASLIFVAKGGSFTVLAHEANTDKMDEAMDIRDRLVKAISGS